MTLQTLDLGLRERHQRQIARAAPARPRRRRMPRKRHGGVAAVPQPHSITRPSPVRIRRRRKTPEIVEADLWRRKAGKLRTRPRVQIPQQPVAKPVARHPTQLLLDQLERPPKRRTAAQSLLNIYPAHIQPHRVEAGEPAYRARKIDIRRHLLAPVTLHINQHRGTGATATAPAPRRPQPPTTPPQAQAPGCATTPRQSQDDGWSAADDQTAALRRQTTPPAPALPPPAKAGSPPHAHARRCTPHAPQHQDHQCRSVGGRRPHPHQPAPPPASIPPPPRPLPAAAASTG